jgi:hypothetical protein
MKRVIEVNSPLNGDYTLYAGLFEAVGVYMCVDLCVDDNGRVWRNPEASSNQVDYQNSSSRDMLMGVLLSLRLHLAERVYDYLKLNKGKLSPRATDNRNKAGIVGMCYLSLLSGRGWERHLSWMLSPILLLSTLVPLKKPYELHLLMCTLLLHKRIGKWGRCEKWTLKLLDYASPMNAVVKFTQGDVVSLRRIHEGLLDRAKGDWDDHWPFASYEPWRDKRMAHPSAAQWVVYAITKLSGRPRLSSVRQKDKI